MGNEYSQEDYDRFALDYYETSLQNPCLLLDIGIDESLLKFSGTDSNTMLKAYSNELVNKVPGYINNLGARLAPLTVVPNAVGLGALVISMIMELCMLSRTQSVDTYSMLQRVFAEEKASSVRDTMSEYLRRHEIFMNMDQRLQEELRRLEAQLSNHLTILRNSLLHDGQMSTRGLKIWVNGAYFHIQMLIHEGRLAVQAGKRSSDHHTAISSAINSYLEDLGNLLKNYKTYKTSTTVIDSRSACPAAYQCFALDCYIKNYENNKEICKVSLNWKRDRNPCEGYQLKEAYINYVFSNYEPITHIRNHFLNIKYSLTTLISQHYTFPLPPTT